MKIPLSSYILLLLFVLLLLIPYTKSTPSETNPGLTITVHQSLLDASNTYIKNTIERLILGLTIPDITGRFHVKVIGDIDYWITGIKISGIGFSKSMTQIVKDGVQETVVDAYFDMSADYKWRKVHFIHTSDHGTVDIDVTGVSVGFHLVISEVDGRPSIHTPSVAFNIEHIDLKFHGSVSWIYNELVSIFRGVVRKSLNENIPTQLVQAINVEAEEALEKLPIVFPFGTVDIDLTLLSSPVYASDYFSFSLKGDSRSTVNPTQCPYTPQILPISTDSDMLEVYVGDYSPNCYLNVLYEQKMLKYEVNNTNFPKNDFISLNTSSFRYIVPNLDSKYPNRGMVLDIYAHAPPRIDSQKNGILSPLEVGIDVNVLLNDQESVVAFTIKAVFEVNFTLSTIDGDKVLGKMNSLACNFTIEKSHIGPISIVPLIDFVLEPMCNYLLPPLVNEYLSKGIEIPSEFGFSAKNVILSMGDGFLGISTDIVPPSDNK